jgi:hypothetical protein
MMNAAHPPSFASTFISQPNDCPNQYVKASQDSSDFHEMQMHLFYSDSANSQIL